MKKRGFISLLAVLSFLLSCTSAGEASHNNILLYPSPLIRTNVLSEQRVGVFLIDYVNDGNEQTREQVQEAIFHSAWSINNFVRDSSYNKTWLTGDIFGWMHLTEEERYCWPDDGTLLIHFQDQEIDFQQYEQFVFLIRGKKTGCPWGSSSFGKAPLRTPDGMVNASVSRVRTPTFYFPSDISRTTNQVLAHELIHAFGVSGHANAYECGAVTLTANRSSCLQLPERDSFDIMGGRYWSSQPNACYKEELGWLNATEIKTVRKSGKYVLYPFESDSSKIKALKIPLRNPLPIATLSGSELFMTAYYLEYRIGQGVDERLLGLANGLYLAPTPISTQGVMVRGALFIDGKCTTTYLLDMHPESYPNNSSPAANDWIDSFLYVGEKFVDTANGITITPTKISGDGIMTLSVKIAELPLIG
ncbi:MAG: hypothetical protein Q8R53_06425 [Nanoarchaeota archaeon]|nr:hypothetical protein [Nanoarchaeota archaeon]